MPMSLWCTKLSRTTLLGKKTQKPTTQKKKPLQWQQNFKQKNRKTICSWSFTCSWDSLPFRVVGCHVAPRMHTALATITHVHETGFNKFMFNSQEWIVIGGCCSSSIWEFANNMPTHLESLFLTLLRNKVRNSKLQIVNVWVTLG
jgi:hypothetical protein